MVKISKTWLGKFIDGRKDLRELRERNYLQFLKVLVEDSKAVEPLPSYKEEALEDESR